MASPAKRGVGAAVAEHPDEEHVDRRLAVDRLAVDRPEQEEQHWREHEDEHRRLAVPPEEPLLHPHLVAEQGERPPEADRESAPRALCPSTCELIGGLLVDEAEVDVLERRPPDLEPFELATCGERRGRQLGEDPGRLRRSSTTMSLAVLAVPDLDVSARRRSAPRASRCATSALADHGDAVGELLRLVEVVGREEDRLAERAQRADEIPRSAARGRVEPGRRLVEEHELGVADQRDAEVETPLLAARERLHARVASCRQVRPARSPRRRPAAARSSPRTSGCTSRTESRAGSSECWSTTPIRSRCARARLPRVDAEHLDIATVARPVALEDLDGRRLARAVRAEEPEDLARLGPRSRALGRPRARRRTCAASAPGSRRPGRSRVEVERERVADLEAGVVAGHASTISRAVGLVADGGHRARRARPPPRGASPRSRRARARRRRGRRSQPLRGDGSAVWRARVSGLVTHGPRRRRRATRAARRALRACRRPAPRQLAQLVGLAGRRPWHGDRGGRASAAEHSRNRHFAAAVTAPERAHTTTTCS